MFGRDCVEIDKTVSTPTPTPTPIPTLTERITSHCSRGWTSTWVWCLTDCSGI